jgi:hypothetical protein
VTTDKLEDLLEKQGRLVEAEPLAADVYRRAQHSEFSDRELTGVASKYGVLLVKLGRFADAQVPLLEAHDRLRRAGFTGSKSNDDVWDALAKTYDATQRPEEAQRLRLELTTMHATTQPATRSTTTSATAPASNPERIDKPVPPPLKNLFWPPHSSVVAVLRVGASPAIGGFTVREAMCRSSAPTRGKSSLRKSSLRNALTTQSGIFETLEQRTMLCSLHLDNPYAPDKLRNSCRR